MAEEMGPDMKGRRRKVEKFQLSPSSMSLFQACQRKFWHYKINQTETDEGADDSTEALDIGSAFHKVLEDREHDLNGLKYKEVAAACKEHDLDPDKYAPMLFAMLSSYKKTHEASGLDVIKCELELSTSDFIGYVDAVMVDREGYWWIVDMKTASAITKFLPETVHRHPQLNLYAYHFYDIADELGLDPEKFGGCRYRATTKSKLKQKKTESLGDYIKRMAGNIDSTDYIIPFEDMDPVGIKAIHDAIHSYIGLRKRPIEKFICNYSNCTAYWRVCEYYSQCHGKEYEGER